MWTVRATSFPFCIWGTQAASPTRRENEYSIKMTCKIKDKTTIGFQSNSFVVSIIRYLTYQPRPKGIQGLHQHKGAARGTIYPPVRRCSGAPGINVCNAFVRTWMLRIIVHVTLQCGYEWPTYLNSKHSSQESQHGTLSKMLIFWSFVFSQMVRAINLIR